MTAVDLLLTVLVLGVIVIAGTVVVGALAGGAREGRAVGGRVDEGSAAPLGEAHRLMPRPGSAVDVPSGTRRADRCAFSLCIVTIVMSASSAKDRDIACAAWPGSHSTQQNRRCACPRLLSARPGN